MGKTASLADLDGNSTLRDEIAHLLIHGGVLISPTDTCYGFSCSPFHDEAVERVYRLKRRDRSQPLLLLVDSLEHARRLMEEAPPYFETLAQSFWPAPLTLIVPASAKVPSLVRGGGKTIGIRMPDFAPLIALMRVASLPLAWSTDSSPLARRLSAPRG